MMMKKVLILGAALATFATAASAVEHNVRIISKGYFPETVYVHAGDTVRFYNRHSYTREACATDGTWCNTYIRPGRSYTIRITDDMVQNNRGLRYRNSRSSYYYGNIVIGDAPDGS